MSLARRGARRSSRLGGQIVVDARERANALAGRGEDRVRHRTCDRWRSGLARAAPELAAARNEMDIDLRRLGQAHHPIGVEVALHRSAVLKRDLAVKRGAQPEYHGA